MDKNRNLLVRIAYVGTFYHGFQVQKNALTVQEVFQNALRKSIGVLPDIKGCSRTDTGVHAREYGISFYTGSNIGTERLVEALNFHLPTDIRVMSVTEMSSDFHARYSATGKRYCYFVWNDCVMDPFHEGRALHFVKKIDEAELHRTAQQFVGTHDFTPFSGSKRNEGNTVRTVFSYDVDRKGKFVVFSVEADGFLYNMVRVMVGSLLSVARGKLTANDIRKIFESGIRPNECFTAPASGLYLDRVFYNPEDFR